MVHLNISPENIFINQDKIWKIGGFEFLRKDEKIDFYNELKPNFVYSSYTIFDNINFNQDLYSIIITIYHILSIFKSRPLLLPENIKTKE